MSRAVFLDRDGVLNPLVYNVRTGEYESPHRGEDFSVYPYVVHSLRALADAGLLLLSLYLVGQLVNLLTLEGEFARLFRIYVSQLMLQLLLLRLQLGDLVAKAGATLQRFAGDPGGSALAVDDLRVFAAGILLDELHLAARLDAAEDAVLLAWSAVQVGVEIIGDIAGADRRWGLSGCCG